MKVIWPPKMTFMLASRFAPIIGLMIGVPAKVFSQSIVVVSTAQKAGDDFGTIQYKDPNGVTHDIGWTTADPSTPGPDIPKGMGPALKAGKVADAIRAGDIAEDGEGDVTVTAGADGTVTVTGSGGNTSKGGSYNNKTKQAEKKWRKPATLSVPGAPAYIGTVVFSGPISGINDDGLPAVATIGTNTCTVTLSTGSYPDANALARAFVNQLQACGVNATKGTRGTVIVTLSETEDELRWGNDDKTLDQESSWSQP